MRSEFRSSADAFTLSVVDVDGPQVLQRLRRGWTKPRGAQVDLEAIVAEIASVVKAFGLSEVYGDRYTLQWVVEAFTRAGVRYCGLQALLAAGIVSPPAGNGKGRQPVT